MSWYGAGRNRNKIYVGNLSSRTKEEDIRSEFSKYGDVVDVIMKYDFAFVEMDDDRSMDNAIDHLDRCEVHGRRWKVEPARRSRPPGRDMGRGPPRGGFGRRRAGMRPTRGEYRMEISGLSSATSWQDLKDWARQAGDSVVYGDVFVEKGKRMGVIEFDRRDDFEHALKHLHKDKLHGKTVTVRKEGTRSGSESSRSRSRSRSPRRNDKRKRSRRSRSRGERGRSGSASSRSRSRSYSRSRSRSRKRGSPERSSRNYHSSHSRSSSPGSHHSKSPSRSSPKPATSNEESAEVTTETTKPEQAEAPAAAAESAPAEATAEGEGSMDVDQK